MLRSANSQQRSLFATLPTFDPGLRVSLFSQGPDGLRHRVCLNGQEKTDRIAYNMQSVGESGHRALRAAPHDHTLSGHRAPERERQPVPSGPGSHLASGEISGERSGGVPTGL